MGVFFNFAYIFFVEYHNAIATYEVKQTHLAAIMEQQLKIYFERSQL